MESIILNLLNLTGEERAAFAVLAPQRFHPDGAGLTVEDWQSAQVILGNPPPECLRGKMCIRDRYHTTKSRWEAEPDSMFTRSSSPGLSASHWAASFRLL